MMGGSFAVLRYSFLHGILELNAKANSSRHKYLDVSRCVPVAGGADRPDPAMRYKGTV
jgi:hypothetical protein